MKFEIKNRWNGLVIFECEALTIKAAVELALEKRVNLRGSDLSGSDLRGSDLSGSDLRGSDLSGSNLSGSDLRGSDLRGSDLRGSNLSGSNLRGSNLSGSDLSDVKTDFFEKLLKLKSEAAGLYQFLLDGKIDGSVYSGECSCFCGTIAKSKGVPVEGLKQFGIKPDSSSPVEKWFMGIRKGDTPANNPISAVTKEWLEEFMKANEIVIPSRQVIWHLS